MEKINKLVRDMEARFNIYLIGVSEGEEGKVSRGNISEDNGQEFFYSIKKTPIYRLKMHKDSETE